ncbi:MAG: 2-octaprenyl-6-methoxyphenol hydroxylase oxidoreductase [Betaproteobacteria bacterium]|nr:2-octaprenyl-6-methoxyphenol hydroxylase oxidoreductase [Betaproteobacteria bacterium]
MDATGSPADIIDTPPVLIAGAGPVGLTTALALHARGIAVQMVDAKPREALGHDPRAVALAHGSRLILERLGVWKDIGATPIRHIRVSQQDGFGQTRIEAADHGVDALGYVVRLGPLNQVLLQAVEQRGIPLRFHAPLGHVAHGHDTVIAQVGSVELQAALVVYAEGKPAGAGVVSKPYGQTAIVTEAFSAEPHEGLAQERFTTQGPLALLPLEKGYSIVWCMKPERAEMLMALDDAGFLAALSEATGFARRTWRQVAARHAYPLTLVTRGAMAHAREIALGNASQTLHPVAGQGLNLGLRDAFELAESLEGGVNAATLAAYARRRRFDRTAMIALTDRYVSLFSNDIAPLRGARGIGLAALNLLPPLRGLVARRMMFGLR